MPREENLYRHSWMLSSFPRPKYKHPDLDELESEDLTKFSKMNKQDPEDKL
jgi:hypothetical protein